MQARLVSQRRWVVRTSGVWLVLVVLLAVTGGFMPSAGASSKHSTELTGPQMAAASQCQWSACAKILAAVSAGTKVQSLPSDLSPSLQAASTSVQAPKGMLGCVVGQPALQTPLPCVDNAAATTKRMVLIGDSHADMWSQAVANIAVANGYSLLFLAKIPCPLPLVGFWNGLNNTPNPQCTSWKKWAFTRIQQFNPNVVIATTEDRNPIAGNNSPMSQSRVFEGPRDHAEGSVRAGAPGGPLGRHSVPQGGRPTLFVDSHVERPELQHAYGAGRDGPGSSCTAYGGLPSRRPVHQRDPLALHDEDLSCRDRQHRGLFGLLSHNFQLRHKS